MRATARASTCAGAGGWARISSCSLSDRASAIAQNDFAFGSSRSLAQRLARGLLELGGGAARLARGRAHQPAKRRRAGLQPDRLLQDAHAGRPELAGPFRAAREPPWHPHAARQRSGTAARRASPGRRSLYDPSPLSDWPARRRACARGSTAPTALARILAQRERRAGRPRPPAPRSTTTATYAAGAQPLARGGQERGAVRRVGGRALPEPDHARAGLRARDRYPAGGRAAGAADRTGGASSRTTSCSGCPGPARPSSRSTPSTSITRRAVARDWRTGSRPARRTPLAAGDRRTLVHTRLRRRPAGARDARAAFPARRLERRFRAAPGAQRASRSSTCTTARR